MIIYRLTSPSGGVYIGQTCNFKERMRGHGKDAFGRSNCALIGEAIRLHGWANFKKEIVFDVPKELSDGLESSLIAEYKALGISYNIESGGRKGNTVPESTKAKMSQFRKNFTGWKHADETKLKISKNNGKFWQGKTGKKNIKSKPIIQLDLEGNFIKEWDCAMDVYRDLGISNRSISNMCTGVIIKTRNKFTTAKSAGGFKWKFKDLETESASNTN